MNDPIRLLLVEDDEDDAFFLIRELRRSGMDLEYEQVLTAPAFEQALKSKTWDAIVSDYNLPSFSAPKALEILKKTGLDVPFVVVSGAIGEETAVDLMRAGAHDYFVKGKLNRLAEALRREIRDTKVRQHQRHAEQALRESEEQLRLLFERSRDAIFIIDRKTGQYLDANQSAESLTGRSIEALRSLTVQSVTPESAAEWLRIAEYCDKPTALGNVNYLQPDDNIRTASMTMLPINAERIFGIAHDITEQLQNETALKNRAQELEALYHTSLKINAQADLFSLLQTIVEQATNLVNASMGGLYLLRNDEKSLELVVAHNLPGEMLGARLKLGEGLSGRVAQSGEVMMVSDYKTWNGQADIYKDSPFRRVLGAPLKVKENVIGVINVTDDAKTGSYTPDQVRLVSLFADQAAIAVENARLLDNLQHELNERKQAEQSLRSTQTFLDNVLRAVPLGIGVYNIKTRQMEFDNELNSVYSGSNRAKFNNLSDLELWAMVHPDDRQRRVDFMQQLKSLQDGEVREIEIRRKNVNEDWRWYLHRYYVFERDQTGEIQKLLTVIEDVTERKFAEQALQHQLKELISLHEIARAGIQADSIDGLISFITTEISASFYPENFGFLILDETLEFLTPHPSYRGIDVAIPRKVGVDDCLSGEVVLTGKPIRLGNVKTNPKYYEVTHSIQSELCVPIKVGEKILGVINTESSLENHFTENDERLLTTIAGQTGIAIERIRLFESERKRRQEAETLRQATAALSTSLDLDQVLESMLKSLKQVVPYDSAAVFLREGEFLYIRVVEGIEEAEELLSQSFPADDALFQEMALSSKPVILADAQKDPRFKMWGNTSYTRGWLSVPLIWRENIIGFITLDSRVPAAYSQEEAALAQAFAHQAAAAIENARLFEGLENSLLDLNQAYESTIEGWSRAMDLRDKETEGHTLRVTKMTVQLAEKMGITGKDLIHIRYGALLHDIGKLGVPDRILLKPDALTAEEWVIMRRHPVYAHQMLSGVEYLQPSLDIPYRHHERWDGSGYPGGLKGEEIPLSARLFAVVDVWDALTSDRPYRPAWTSQEALEYIIACSGKHFEPYVVEKFLEIIQPVLQQNG